MIVSRAFSDPGGWTQESKPGTDAYRSRGRALDIEAERKTIKESMGKGWKSGQKICIPCDYIGRGACREFYGILTAYDDDNSVTILKDGTGRVRKAM